MRRRRLNAKAHYTGAPPYLGKIFLRAALNFKSEFFLRV
jgi:hypothetical protein